MTKLYEQHKLNFILQIRLDQQVQTCVHINHLVPYNRQYRINHLKCITNTDLLAINLTFSTIQIHHTYGTPSHEKNLYIAFTLSYTLKHYVNRYGKAKDDRDSGCSFSNVGATLFICNLRKLRLSVISNDRRSTLRIFLTNLFLPFQPPFVERTAEEFRPNSTAPARESGSLKLPSASRRALRHSDRRCTGAPCTIRCIPRALPHSAPRARNSCGAVPPLFPLLCGATR